MNYYTITQYFKNDRGLLITIENDILGDNVEEAVAIFRTWSISVFENVYRMADAYSLYYCEGIAYEMTEEGVKVKE